MAIPKPLIDLAPLDIEELCSQAASESRTLEFKQSLPAKDDRGKAELLKDVVAFANASGGDIIFGLGEEEGVATGITPISSESFDQARLRIFQVIDAGVEPAIRGIDVKELEVGDGYVLVLRIPPYSSGPFRMNFSGRSRFVVREPGYVRDMTYPEIRDAFSRRGLAQGEAKRFRETRDHINRARKTWRPMPDGPLCAVYVMPLSSMGSTGQFSVKYIEQNWNKFIMPSWGGGSKVFNIDGLIIYPGNRAEHVNFYIQIYRDGCMEFLFSIAHGNIANTIPSLSLCEYIRDSIAKAFDALRNQDIFGPVAIAVSLFDVQAAELGLGSGWYRSGPPKADRPDLIVPEIVVESSASDEPIIEAQRELLNVLWQGFGLSACSYYNEHGNWQPSA